MLVEMPLATQSIYDDKVFVNIQQKFALMYRL